MEKVKNKNLYIGYICAGFIFLFFPAVSIIDIMPDFIGFILIVKGTCCMFDLNEDVAAARSAFIKLFFIDLAKTVSVPFFISLNDETTTMTSVFIFSIIEGILLYNALSSLFTGINYLAERADSPFADKGYGDARITVGIFVIGRYVLQALPELTVLTSLDYQMTDDLSDFTVYDFKTIITIACFVISLIIGLHFLSGALKYVNRLKRDEVLRGYLYGRYEKEVIENKNLLIRRNSKNASAFIFAGLILMCPFYFEGVDITPTPVALMLLYLGISRLCLIEASLANLKRLCLVCIPLSTALYAFSCYIGGKYHHWSYQIEDEARFMYKLWGCAQAVDTVLFAVCAVCIFFAVMKIVSRYGTNANINKEGFQYKEQLKTVRRLCLLLKCSVGCMAAVTGARCVFFFLYPDHEFIWLVSFAVSMICAVFCGKSIYRVHTAVEDNNM